MSNSRTVLYGGNYKLFPADAAGQRVLSIARILHDSKFKVELWPALGHGSGRGINYSPAQDFDEVRVDSSRRRRRFLGLLRRACLERNINVLLYNPTSVQTLFTWICSVFSDSNLVGDITEWYEYSHLSSLTSKLEVFVRMNVAYRLFGKIISISEFLSDFYRRAVVVTVPPIIEDELIATQPKGALRPGESIKVVYAGFPGKKDRVDLLVKWLDEATEGSEVEVELFLLGPPADSFRFVTRSPRLKLHMLGKVSREVVSRMYREAHWSGIVRDDARYEWAGFPSKAVEGWAQGVPVVALSHSRFARLAKNYHAAVVIDVANPVDSLRQSIKLLADKPETITQMSSGAIRLAAEQHVSKNYKSGIENLFL